MIVAVVATADSAFGASTGLPRLRVDLATETGRAAGGDSLALDVDLCGSGGASAAMIAGIRSTVAATTAAVSATTEESTTCLLRDWRFVWGWWWWALLDSLDESSLTEVQLDSDDRCGELGSGLELSPEESVSFDVASSCSCSCSCSCCFCCCGFGVWRAEARMFWRFEAAVLGREKLGEIGDSGDLGVMKPDEEVAAAAEMIALTGVFETGGGSVAISVL